jgi:hypothetical protein
MGDEDDEDHEYWDQLVRSLAIPEDLRQHIEKMATRKGVSSWDYILLVLRRDADRTSASRDRRN